MQKDSYLFEKNLLTWPQYNDKFFGTAWLMLLSTLTWWHSK